MRSKTYPMPNAAGHVFRLTLLAALAWFSFWLKLMTGLSMMAIGILKRMANTLLPSRSARR